MTKLEEALKLAREAEEKYSNDWNGLLAKKVRVALEEAIEEINDLH